MKKQSEIQEAIEWLSWRISGIRETAYDEEKAKEMELLKKQLLKQRRITDFQRVKLKWLKLYCVA